jgi:hypothetical protein
LTDATITRKRRRTGRLRGWAYDSTALARALKATRYTPRTVEPVVAQHTTQAPKVAMQWIAPAGNDTGNHTGEWTVVCG